MSAMTTVETHLKIGRHLNTEELDRLANLSSVYGIRKISAEGGQLMVEFDATRLSEAEVISLIRGVGIPADRV